MSSRASEAILVLTTAATGDEANRLAELLVGANLAACVQILPETNSVYRWQGQVHRETEALVLIKTVESRFEEIQRQIHLFHSYDVPEIFGISAKVVSQPYLKWLIETLEPQPDAR